jgi:hypothetical protein
MPADAPKPDEIAPQTFFQRNRRLVIGSIMVLLVIAFLVPTQLPQLMRDTNRQLGTLNGKSLRARDIEESFRSWQALRNVVINANGQDIPLINLAITPDAVRQIADNPVIWHLLREEARRDGPGASSQEVSNLLESSGQPGQVLIRHNDGRLVSIADLGSATADAYRAAVADLLAIANRFQSLENTTKVSRPIVDRYLATEFQAVSARFAPVPAVDAASIPVPSEADILAHFKKYAEFPPGSVSRENPFGFGYRIPNRIKFQTITIPFAPIRAAVRDSRGTETDPNDPSLPYEWVTEAAKYYQSNPGEFTVTPPTTENPPAAETTPTTPPSPAPANTTPVKKPFDEVRAELVNRLIDQAAVAQMRTIEQRIRNRHEADYLSWKTARDLDSASTPTPPTSPATSSPAPDSAPAAPTNANPRVSSLGVPFDSTDYLTALAQEIERQFKVNIRWTSHADRFYSADDISALAGIGRSVAMLNTGERMLPLPMASYAVDFFESFMPANVRDQLGSTALSLYELSMPMQSFLGEPDLHIFRIIDTDASHAPTEIPESDRVKIVADLQRTIALSIARAKADQLLERARAAGSIDAISADAPAGVTGELPLSVRLGAPEALNIPEAARDSFIHRAMEALLDSSASAGIVAFDVPTADRAFVAQRISLTSEWISDQGLAQTRMQLTSAATRMLQGAQDPQLAAFEARRAYFDINAIQKRTNFVPAAN